MAQSIYGGRVDNEFDQRLLNTFLERLFTTKSFDSEFKLACKVDGHKDIQMPDGIRYEPPPPPPDAPLARPSRPGADRSSPPAGPPGERSSCSGWSCCPTPRRPPGWACPTTRRGSSSPPRVSARAWPPGRPRTLPSRLRCRGQPRKSVLGCTFSAVTPSAGHEA